MPERVAALDLGSDGFPELVSQHEGRLILAIEIAGKLEHRNALGCVRKDDDCGQEVHELHFPAGEDRAACDAELMAAGFALMLAAGRNVVVFERAAARANRLTLGFRPAKLLEFGKRCLLAAGIDLPEAYCAGCRAEEKVARHHHFRYVSHRI